MQISKTMMKALERLEETGQPLREISVPGKEQRRRRHWPVYIRNQRVVADSRVEPWDILTMGTVVALMARSLVSTYHKDILTGGLLLRINERGRAAVKQGNGNGLEARCPLCFGLIAPSFPIHECNPTDPILKRLVPAVNAGR